MRSPVNASPMPSRASAHELGVDAVRYSFIVMDLHHLLLAGLPAHSALPRSTDIVRPARHVSNVPRAEVAVAAYSIKSLVRRDRTVRHSGSPALRRPSIYI